ncbi:hypothetical protein [Aquimarina sp. 2201CG14-23]|uniref:hypothetical protein n=1 Tax=Aquimarina mycalae TaxID=3040073 RepID=UPI002477D008|nr:hypothetical protein [Aquimarina sp. 2201CG14-23]MDH7445834.1 hypothetical protein [Aquimarina sp. 2201CG14-23]
MVRLKNYLILPLVLLVLSACNTSKVPISLVKREVNMIPNRIIGWEYYVELINGNIKSETIYNSNKLSQEDTLEKAIEAIQVYALHDSLIKRKVLKPILELPNGKNKAISSF